MFATTGASCAADILTLAAIVETLTRALATSAGDVSVGLGVGVGVAVGVGVGVGVTVGVGVMDGVGVGVAVGVGDGDGDGDELAVLSAVGSNPTSLLSVD